jgi:ABC-type multidrug transport system fused ATPase/permease subunit
MNTWFTNIKEGLSRTHPDDRLADERGDAGDRANLQNLRPFAARHWRRGVLGALLLLLSSLLSFPLPLINRYLIDEVILGQQLNLLFGVVALLVVVKLLHMLVKAWQSYYFTHFEQGVLIDIQEDLLSRTLRLPKAFFDKEETGYLMSRLLSDVNGLRWFFSSTLVNIINSSLRFLGGVVFLIYLEWRLSLASLIILPGLIFAVRLFSNRMRVLGLHGMEEQAEVSRAMQETLSSTELIKAYSSEQRTIRGLMDKLRATLKVRLEQVAVNSMAGLAISLIPEIVRVVVLVIGVYWIILGSWTLGSLLAFQSYLGFVFGPAKFLANANLQLQNALASLERISALYDIVPESNQGQGRKIDRLQGKVDFEKVTFSYDGKETVLDEVSFHIEPGDTVAIVGPSGVGKTTLVSLILRFYKPTAGEIFLDGVPGSEFELDSLRRRIGYVSQSTLLLSGTIADNLRYGNPEADDEQIIHAAKVAGIHSFIINLPNGYDALVGERGVNLSEGQKQRLSIARALVSNPDILVMDEPTSALDSLVEKTIFDRLPEIVREKTTFIIAHRLSSIQHSDRILLLNEKRLIATGRHSELLKTSAYYRTLVANQEIIP